MNPVHYSELIALLYDVSSNARLWPVFLEKLIVACEQTDQVSQQQLTTAPIDKKRFDYDVSQMALEDIETHSILTKDKNNLAEQQAVERLFPHLVRFMQIDQKKEQQNQQMALLQSISDQLDVGVLILNSNGLILKQNDYAQNLLSGNKWLKNKDSCLNACSPDENKLLQQKLQYFQSIPNDEYLIEAMNIKTSQQSNLLLSMMSVSNTEIINTNQPRLVLCFIYNNNNNLSESTLKQLYELTKAESRLVNQLLKGKNLEQCAALFYLEKSTLSTQLKSIFCKTNTHSQAELIRLLLSNPLLLHIKPNGVNKKVYQSSDKTENPNLDQTMILADGRKLGFAEYGHKQGKPIVFMHGIAGCRLQCHPEESILKENQIRLIIPDRPGYGFSDPLDGRNRQDWAKDVEQLANHLNIAQFAVMGFSIGGSFAQACAYFLPDRVNKLYLVASLAPVETVEDLKKLAARERMVFALSRYAPKLLYPLMYRFVQNTKKNPEAHFQYTANVAPDGEQIILKQPKIKATYINALKQATVQGGKGIVHEIALSSGKWGFDLAKIQQPVKMWYGGKDRYLPTYFSEKMANKFPSVSKHCFSGSGHNLIYTHWESIIKNL